MKEMEPLVAVSIVNYNNGKTIIKSIESVLNQSYENLELYIVDNGSKDGSLEEIEKSIDVWNQRRLDYLKNKEDYYPIKLIKNNQNVGFGTANNQVIRSSNADYILLLNSDAFLEKDFIKEALKEFTPDFVGAVQGKVFRYDFEKSSSSNIIDTVGISMLKSRRTICIGQGQVDNGQFEKSVEIFGADGAIPLFRMTALDSIKIPIIKKHHSNKDYEFEYFDEDFFLYKEDIDLDWRLRLAGWKTMYCPKAVAFHGRGSGESNKTKYSEILKERKKISLFSKKLSFKHQRFMQIKNDNLFLLIRHLPQFMIKEVGTWIYVIIIEKFGFSHFFEMFKKLPLFLKKRQEVQKLKKVNNGDMLKWFC